MKAQLAEQLQTLARQRRDQARAASMRADQILRDGCAQLNSLQEYQRESRQKQMRSGRLGSSVDQIALHHHFDANLDKVIHEQKSRVERLQQSSVQAMGRLRLAQVTLAAYEALITRWQQLAAKGQQRREQKGNDEIAARVHANRLGA